MRTPWLRNVNEDITPQAGGDFDFNSKRVYDIKVLDFKAPTELTLDTDGAMTVTQTFHIVDTFGDAGSDDLVTINGYSNGRLLVIKAANDGRTVVVKHNTGNIWLQGKVDISLDDISDGLMLVYSTTDSKWFDISASSQTHAMLDGVTHSDSVAQGVTRGSLIYGNSTPKWDELVKGVVDTFLGSDGTDISYRTAAQVIASLSGDANATFSWNNQILSAIKGLLLTSATELTMDTDGIITVTQMVHTVDTFSDAGSDDLVTINGGTTVGLIILRPEHADRTVVVKDGGGNIELIGESDITLDDITDHLMLFWDTTNSKWVDIGAGKGAAVTTHDILDGSVHTDSIGDAVTRGSIIYGNSTPKWDELVKGGADTFLGSDGTDVSYRTAAQVLASLSGEANATFSWNDQILSALKGMLLTTATELTMDTSGVITVTQMVHTVDTFENAASDNLDTINGGTVVGLIIIRPADDGRTVVVRDGVGNIELIGGKAITLDHITDHVMLFWDTTNSKWVDVGAGGGTPVEAHAMLDGSVHTDSVADAVTRGSIIYANATPKWDELVKGGANTFLGSDGTDVSYRSAAQVLASLSGAANATFDLNDQSLTGATIVIDTTLAKALEITSQCSTAQIYIGGSGILAANEQAIYINCPSETNPTNGVWITLKSSSTSGDLTGVRSRVYGNAASAGANIRGGYLEAKMEASKYAAMLEGLLSHADYSAGSVRVSGDVRGLTAFISQGADLEAANLYGALVHVQTRGDETITTDDIGLLLRNEAVGGNGRMMDCALKIADLNMGGGTAGYDIGIDLTGATYGTSALKLGGKLDVQDNSIQLKEILANDHLWSGVTTTGIAGAALAFGELCYLDGVGANDKWELTDSDAEATAGDVMLGICVLAANEDAATELLLHGLVRDDDRYDASNAGDALYIECDTDGDPGALRATRPSGSGDIVRVAGYAFRKVSLGNGDAQTIFFKPSGTWLEV